jgi:hypothetical protein
MQTKFKHGLLQVGLLVMALGMLCACSDDEKNYLADVYFTKTQSMVTVVASTGTPAPLNGSSAMDVCFDAAADWTISAIDSETDLPADWVRFYTTSGKAGSQLIGIYPTANTTGKDRFATIQIACNGSTISCLVLQPTTTIIENPNLANINANKTIKKAVFTPYDVNDCRETYDFTYTSGVVSSITEDKYDPVSDKHNAHTYTFECEGRIGDSKMLSVNKITSDSRAYAVANGMIVRAYYPANNYANEGAYEDKVSYSGGYMTEINKRFELSMKYTWADDNISIAAFATDASSSGKMTYGSELNDCNLDINWLIAKGVMYGFDNNWLHVMNLTGKRCRNLVSSFHAFDNPNKLVTYSDGVVDADGATHKGLTATIMMEGHEQYGIWQFYFE